MMRVPLAAVAFAMAAVTFASSAAAAPCPPEKLASFDLSYTPSGKPMAPIDIGGHRINLKVETGGLESMLSDEVVRALDLPRGTISNYGLKVGSDPVDQYATAQNVAFGGRPPTTMRFLIMPPVHLEKEVGGTLGPNIFASTASSSISAATSSTCFRPRDVTAVSRIGHNNPTARRQYRTGGLGR